MLGLGRSGVVAIVDALRVRADVVNVDDNFTAGKGASVVLSTSVVSSVATVDANVRPVYVAE